MTEQQIKSLKYGDKLCVVKTGSGIPVGTIVTFSGWLTKYQTFVTIDIRFVEISDVELGGHVELEFDYEKRLAGYLTDRIKKKYL